MTNKILDIGTKNKGPVMSRGWNYIMPMTSRDMIEGGGVGLRGGGGSWKVDQLSSADI